MPTNFPATLDNVTDPLLTDSMRTVSHSSLHVNENDAIEALEVKVGVDGSAIVGSLDYLVKNAASIDPGHKHTVNLAQANTFTAQQQFGTFTLTDGASIAWNLNTGQVAKVTLGGNRTLANPTNMIDGGTYILRVIQDGTGTRTLAYGTAYRWPAGTPPVLSTAAGAVDYLTFVSDGTHMDGVATLSFS